MSDETPDTPQDPQEQAGLELFHQLVNLSPDDGDIFLRLTVRLANGRLVGDVVLSSGDVNQLIESAITVREHRALFGDGDDAAGPLPLAEDDLDEAAVDDVFSGFATLLGSEDGDL